ncbi:uncharacterized protein LOC132716656 [Ruditapes philippinarum]|uniref:uncharacterized protein LOC132716656 n=1 Tax=Ruditapes philippinarum TaxID=129788 RepID=UPI00295AD321|nr:uncharacterized protein LOC132716656 [Ruditapes philippinarum]
MPRNKQENAGKKGGSEVNVAVVMLSQSCIRLKAEQPQNFTFEYLRIFTAIYDGICSKVLYDGPDNGLSVLYNGLDSGDIKENKNKKYKKPFKMLEPVCEDILEEENKQDAVKQTAKQESKKGGGKEGKGGKKGGKGGKNKDKMGEAVMKLKEYCQWIVMHTTVGLPVDFPVDLRARFMKMESVCKGLN